MARYDVLISMQSKVFMDLKEERALIKYLEDKGFENVLVGQEELLDGKPGASPDITQP